MRRRSFLKSIPAAMLTSSLTNALSVRSATAADTSGYKALVCLFFLGGMDHADTLIPFDNSSYNALGNLRPGLFQRYGVGSGQSSRDRENLLALNPDNQADLGGKRYALPEQMRDMRSLFNAGELAFVGGIGPLIEPTTREDFERGSVRVPPQLFSHNDQQSAWQTFGPEGSTLGWGGRFTDALLQSNPSIDQRFVALTTNNTAPFLTGAQAPAFSISPNGNNGLDLLSRNFLLGNDNNLDQIRGYIRDYYSRRLWGNSNFFQRDIGQLQGEGVQSGLFFADQFETVNLEAAFPDTNLGRQLNAVARTISIRDSLGVSRQIFFVSLGGFDTHSGQVNTLPAKQEEISTAILAFRNAMMELNMWNNVTVFSASDFGRTLIDNGDGTDHAWASHHFVTGGSVVGKSIYGTMPSLDINGDDYTASNGRLIPQHSVEQYASTLGRWFGLSDPELTNALPNLQNFGSRDLGFFDAQIQGSANAQLGASAQTSPAQPDNNAQLPQEFGPSNQRRPRSIQPLQPKNAPALDPRDIDPPDFTQRIRSEF